MNSQPPGGRATDERWFALPADRVLALLESNERDGLSTVEVSARLARYGANVLAEARRRSAIAIGAAQLTDTMVLILIGAAIVAGMLGELREATAIIAIVVLDGILGFVQEYRAERAINALKAMSALSARVRRDGASASRPASELVPGDIVLLEAGNIVPADLRVLEAHRLTIEEAVLTGESQAVEKSTDPLDAPDIALGDQRNMTFKGTIVRNGRGAGVVVATGMRTELGRIATLLGDEDMPQTPLQKRLGRFAKGLAVAVVGLCGVIFAAGLLRGEPARLMFMTALSLAVAAVPEALPAVVTVALALGARTMARRHALIRRLPAVETLGSVTYICADKTGTLTENRMRVEEVWTGDDPVESPRLFEAMALDNDATCGEDGELQGDPTETALHRAASEAGFVKEVLALRLPRIAELPFTASRARMTTLHRRDDEVVAYTKGAPEQVLPACRDRLSAGGLAPLDHAAVLAQAEQMAESGLRVLAIAMRRLDSIPDDVSAAETEQTFLGLVGSADPPRREAREAVALCQSAGIHVVMITGDHPATARAIAARVGIAAADGDVLTGTALRSLTDAELDARVREIRVYARVAPEDKIRIVKALQRVGEYVAMTGDGVNDAPALRLADIGVAMGRGGTDVAREAAHMILLDDDFSSIVNAVGEGRRVYDNIRRFVRYILSTNAGEIWTLFLAPFIGLPLPLLPIQILWMNLVTDGLPGIALAAEPAERDTMRRAPRPPGESIFARGLWQHAVWVGLLMAALALGTQAWTIHVGDSHWQSMTFTVLTFSQLAHVLAIRSERQSLFQQGLLTNKPLFGALLLTGSMQMAALYLPVLNPVFHTVPLSAGELLVCVLASSVIFGAVEFEKFLIRRGVLYR